jgi:ubiquinone/menaquinone biosynthesis C-methylase UbiE
MTNPWLHIPASDYEAHMNSPNVAQLAFLALTFKEALHEHDSRHVGLLGCATGNGLEYVEKARTERVTAVDINLKYLDILRERFAGKISGLEIVQADLETCEIKKSSFTLVFAGLVFEYVNPTRVLARIFSWLCPHGIMVAVLQLATAHQTRISSTPYKSLQSLDGMMKLYDPADFQTMAAAAGLQQQHARIVTLASGKSFCIGTYTKQSDWHTAQ